MSDQKYSPIAGAYTLYDRFLRTPRHMMLLSWFLVVSLVFAALFMTFMPWRQTVNGSGTVTSFAPESRPQTIESTISGRIVRWYVQEGDAVNKGDTIAVLADISVSFLDTNLVDRLSELRDRTFDAQEQAIAVAAQRRKQSEQRYNKARAELQNEMVQARTARVRYARADTLFDQDLISRSEYETAQLKLQAAIADSLTAIASAQSALQDVEAYSAEEERVISQAFVAMQEADVRFANAQGRVGAGTIISPTDGTVVRISKAGLGQTVKQGDRLATIVPTTTDQAAEIYVNSLDAAIIEPGKRVSLQFSGFPAIMVSGWQDINVGIFHGIVRVVDAVDDGTGKFRVLVVPDTSTRAWPDRRFLRQGTDVSGWILLETVPVGYEIWRRFLGFPPQFPVATRKSNVPSDSKGKE